MTTDLRAELDTAIREARDVHMERTNREHSILTRMWWNGEVPVEQCKAAYRRYEAALDRYRDLIDVRARWDELDGLCYHVIMGLRSCIKLTGHKCAVCQREAEIKADVRKLLGMPVDGPTEAESARKQDQPSG